MARIDVTLSELQESGVLLQRGCGDNFVLHFYVFKEMEKNCFIEVDLTVRCSLHRV